MRSFDEIKNNVMIYNLKLVTEKYKELRRENITEEEKNEIRKVMKQMQDNIDNIEEITIITIGSEINKFITLIQDNYWDNRDDYYNNFDNFLDICFSLNSKEENYLGITKKDLDCLKGSNPIQKGFGDVLRIQTNEILNTNIPLDGVRDELLKNWLNATKEEEDEAYIKFVEAQRDSGNRKQGDDFYPLFSSCSYIAAKNRILKKNKN